MQFVNQIRLTMWQVRGDALRYGVFQVGQTALNLTLSLLLIALGMGWQGRGAGYAVAVVSFAIIGLVTLDRSSRIEWRFDRAYAKDALRFGVPLIPHVLGTLFIASSDRLMVARLMSVHDAGIYAAAMQIGLVIAMLADAAAKALSPWLYSNLVVADETTKRKVVLATYAFFLALALTAIAFGLVGPRLLLLVGEEFRSSDSVVLYIAIGGAFAGMYLMVVNYVFFARRNGFLSAASLAVGVFNLVASYLLVRRNGAVGAAQAYAASQGLLFLLVWFIAAKVHPMPWLSAFRTPVARPVSI
jgi:O-antigen/teichoic acid export membrane protein